MHGLGTNTVRQWTRYHRGDYVTGGWGGGKWKTKTLEEKPAARREEKERRGRWVCVRGELEVGRPAPPGESCDAKVAWPNLKPVAVRRGIDEE